METEIILNISRGYIRSLKGKCNTEGVEGTIQKTQIYF